MAFPPITRYPFGLDDFFTLYKVYNSTQSTLTSDNNAYADQFEIAPDDREQWAENGFVTIQNELCYYDGLDRDGQGRVIRLKRCLRGINGFSQFNPAGTYIRGFIVAEHHNQMAIATILAEKFIGYNFDTDQSTLDWRIRNLADEARIPDDFSCPEVQFDFEVISQSPATGTVISYSVAVNGPFGSAIISFGDGSTTTTLTGTHTYSVNSKIDPAVTVTNGNCQIVQTPIERDEVAEPTTPIPTPPFTVPVPITPAFPSFIFPSVSFPSTDIVPPPFVDSCIDLSPLNTLSNLSFIGGDFSLSAISIFIPSFAVDLVVSIENPFISLVVPTISVEFPSSISVDLSVEFPSMPVISFGPLPPIPSVISFGNAPNIPTEITFINSPNITSVISFGPAPAIPTIINVQYNNNIPTVINVIPPSSFPVISFGAAPSISVNWGTPPSITCTCVVVCPTSSPMNTNMRGIQGSDYEPLANDIEIEYDLAGLPSVISILAPEKPIAIEHNIPEIIKIEMPNISDIRIIGPENNIPSEINIIAPKKEDLVFSLVAPKSIEIHAIGFPSIIPVVFPEQMPMLSFDRSTFPDEIKVVGIPDSIKIIHDIPTSIEIDWSAAARSFSIPPVEVKPIEVKVDFNIGGRISDDNYPCYKLIPCI